MNNCAFVRQTRQYRANSCLRIPCTENTSLTGAQSAALVTQRCTGAYNGDLKGAYVVMKEQVFVAKWPLC